MLKNLDDENFTSFVEDSFYSVIGFYYPSVEKEVLKVIGQFAETHGNVACAEMDITDKSTPGEYGISKDESPIIVIFKQGNAFKAITDLSIENIENAITPPGKNITLQ